MTVGKHEGNARGYIDFDYAGKNYTVGEVSYVPAWTLIRFSVCPGIEWWFHGHVGCYAVRP